LKTWRCGAGDQKEWEKKGAEKNQTFPNREGTQLRKIKTQREAQGEKTALEKVLRRKEKVKNRRSVASLQI